MFCLQVNKNLPFYSFPFMTDVSQSLAVGFTKAVNSDDNFNVTMRRILEVFAKDAEDAEKLRRDYAEVIAAFPESATPDTPPVPPLAEDPIDDAPTPTGDAPTPTGDDSSPTAERREGTPIPREVTHEVPVVRARTPDAVEGDDVENISTHTTRGREHVQCVVRCNNDQVAVHRVLPGCEDGADAKV